jgi:hypothetical protein
MQPFSVHSSILIKNNKYNKTKKKKKKKREREKTCAHLDSIEKISPYVHLRVSLYQLLMRIPKKRLGQRERVGEMTKYANLMID